MRHSAWARDGSKPISCALCGASYRYASITTHLYLAHPGLSQRTHALVAKHARDQARGWVLQPVGDLLELARLDGARAGGNPA